MDKIFTVNQVREMLNCSHQSVYDWINNGQLKAFRLGAKGNKNKYNRKHWRIAEKDLIAFMETGSSVKLKKPVKTGVGSTATESSNNFESQS